jgi:hypothetical protein
MAKIPKVSAPKIKMMPMPKLKTPEAKLMVPRQKTGKVAATKLPAIPGTKLTPAVDTLKKAMKKK